jgi:CheY-like chemotaxis protein
MRKLILQVEDSNDDARLLELTLSKVGVTNQLVTVQSGEEAVRYMKGEGIYADRARFPLPGVMLVDLKLPGISGFDMMELLIKESFLKAILVVVISGHGEVVQLNRAYSLGAQSFLTKPVKEVDVVNLIKAYPNPWALEQA